MLLNQTAVYGLRAMATLTSLAPGESITVTVLSERTGVPQQYLSKVMRKLVVARLVRSQRGHGGGFALMKAPRQIRILDVLQAIDLELDAGCAFGFAACDPTNPCTRSGARCRIASRAGQVTAHLPTWDRAPPLPARANRRDTSNLGLSPSKCR